MNKPIGIAINDLWAHGAYLHPEKGISFLCEEQMPPSSRVNLLKNSGISIGEDPEMDSDGITVDNLWTTFVSGRELNHQGKNYPPDLLLALVLKKVMKIGSISHDLAPGAALLSVPSYLGFSLRARLMEAGRKAGFTPVRLVSSGEAITEGMTISGELECKGGLCLIVSLGRAGFEVSLVRGGSKSRPPFLLASRGTTHYRGEEIDERIAEHAFRKIRDDVSEKVLSRKDAMNILMASARSMIPTLAAKSRCTLLPEGDLKGLSIPVSDDHLAKLLDKLSDKVTEASREILGVAGIYSEQVDKVILFGSYTCLEPFRKKLSLLFGADRILPCSQPWLEAAGAAAMAERPGEELEAAPVRMDTCIGVALEDGSVLQILRNTSRGLTAVSGTSRLYGYPGDADGLQILLVEGESRLLAQSRPIGTMTIPASGKTMELTVSAVLFNNRIVLKAEGPVTSQTCTIPMEGWSFSGILDFPLISRQRPDDTHLSLEERDLDSIAMVMNSAMENLCFTLSASTGTLVKCSAPNKPAGLADMSRPLCCRKCSETLVLTGDIPLGPMSEQAFQAISSKRNSCTCEKCGHQGSFTLKSSKLLHCSAFPCYDRNGSYVDSILLIYPHRKMGKKPVPDWAYGNMMASAATAMGETIVKVMEDSLFVRGALESVITGAALHNLLQLDPICYQFTICEYKASPENREKETGKKVLMIIPASVSSLIAMGMRRNTSIRGNVARAFSLPQNG
ncbi:MAG: hypothetical protein CVV64_01050 [Candidatus Wallbacteria bacterium HGW-Wallbacteria-1]|jgi:hypothetical protein|uniref:Uncharacterized protein n=1 Tax=Candidatus Wallbacteria bacterium HGW-Wallbacteria-1 TaxID=2013854 RepID=A0A2N1PUK2_9BACT|nr:MAG: hypothetical protein CVV64_01050 [Candidatus Wallbacteria bacterium HGW-Wallbacteria-1]